MSREPEERATELRFERDLTSAIELPDGGRWLPARSRFDRGWRVAILPAVGLVVVAVVVGLQLRDLRESIRSQEPGTSISPAGAASTPASSLAAPEAGSSRSLLVDLGGQGIGVRSEADPRVFFRVDNRTRYAVSGDGRLAYWRTGPDDALPHELHVFDARTRSDRTVLSLTTERAGAAGFLAWSTDGSGLALAVHDADSALEGRNAPQPPRSSSLRLLDLTSGNVANAGSISGAWIVPLSWDRRSGVAVASELGRDGPSSPTRRMYRYEGSAGRLTEVTLPVALESGFVTDPAGRVVLGFETSACGNRTCRTLWIVTLADLRATKHPASADRSVIAAAVHPTSGAVYVAVGGEGNYQIEDWGQRAEGRPRPVAPVSAPGVFHFRPDGTAIVVPTFDLNRRTASLVDPATGATSGTPQLDLIVGVLGGK